MSLLLVPAKRENIEQSIENPVDLSFSNNYLNENFIDNILHRSGNEGIRCWAVTKPKKKLFTEIANGDRVLLTEKGTGLFTHLGTIIGKTQNADFGNALWPYKREYPWEYIYFITDIEKVKLDKKQLIKKLGYDESYTVPGPIMTNWDGDIESANIFGTVDLTRAFRSLNDIVIKAIAKDPQALNLLEWRDLERALAELFDSLGFSVTLTPPSKDGGKDLILQCELSGAKKSYIVEIKHWRSNKKVGNSYVTSFLDVVAKEKRDCGILLSTSGYTSSVFESHTEVNREMLKLGDKTKIISLCQTYVKNGNGLILPHQQLTETLFEGTI